MKNLNTLFKAAAFAVVLFSTAGVSMAATGDELLAGSLPASAMNKSVIGGETLTKAVYEAVLAHKNQAPEIVAAAIPKTRSIPTQKAIVKAAVSALGDSVKDVPKVVYAAIKAAPNCSNSDGKSGYAKDGPVGCECAEEFTRAAIEALGSNPSEKLVDEIVVAAIHATDGRCADRIANAASQAAPQYADSIADAAARAGRDGNGDFANGDDSGIFGPTGRPAPSSFILQPNSGGGGGIVSPVTGVN